MFIAYPILGRTCVRFLLLDRANPRKRRTCNVIQGASLDSRGQHKSLYTSTGEVAASHLRHTILNFIKGPMYAIDSSLPLGTHLY